MKTPQHSKKPKTRAKKETRKKLTPWMEEVEQLGTLKLFPVNEAYLERLAIEMIDWIQKNTDVLVFDEFLIAKSILHTQFYRWMDRCPRLKEYHEHAMMILSTRREKGAIIKKFDSGFIERSMSLYSQKWKDLQVWRSQLKAEQEVALAAATGPKIVIMEKFPEIEKK